MKDLTATYFFIPGTDTSPEQAAQAIADEETTGTWTDLTTRKDYIQYLDGTVESVEKVHAGYITTIHYPYEIFEPGNIPQYLSVVAGNLFGLGRLDGVRLLDIKVPSGLITGEGPKFGITGVRKIVGTEDRPHVGTIIKPKVGLNPKDTAEVAYQAAIGGVDLIKDDETLTDQAFCPMGERVFEVMTKLDDAMEETGRTILYAVNVTSGADKIIENARRALSYGANMVMVDVITAGFSAVQALASESSINVPIHVHRTMHAAITRNPLHGIAMRPIARLVRIAGGDQLHTGTVSGKMGHNKEEVIGDNNALKGDFSDLLPVFPVASGGLHPGKVEAELSSLGTDIVLQAGGGIHGHPEGTAAGATAMRQAVDAYLAGIPASRYAEDHHELMLALEKWGMK